MTAGLAKATTEAGASVIAIFKVNSISKIIYKVKLYTSYKDKWKRLFRETKTKETYRGRTSDIYILKI